MQPAGQDLGAHMRSGLTTVPLQSRPNASPFWIMLLLVRGKLDNGMIACGRGAWELEGDGAGVADAFAHARGELEMMAIERSDPLWAMPTIGRMRLRRCSRCAEIKSKRMVHGTAAAHPRMLM